MARKKVNLALIPNGANRRSTFKKRRTGLIKKVSELATLCDVKACAVIYSPDVSRPEVWPSESEARNLFQRLKAMPQREQSKKMMDQEGFLRQRVAKLAEQVVKQQRENNELEMRLMLGNGGRCRQRWVGEMGFEEVVLLERMIAERAKAVEGRMEVLRAANRVRGLPSGGDHEEEDGKMVLSLAGGGGPINSWRGTVGVGGGGGGGLEEMFMKPTAYGISSGGGQLAARPPAFFNAWPTDSLPFL